MPALVQYPRMAWANDRSTARKTSTSGRMPPARPISASNALARSGLYGNDGASSMWPKTPGGISLHIPSIVPIPSSTVSMSSF